jgi:hypothetical protein
MTAGKPSARPDANTLSQQLHDLDGLGLVNPYCVQRVLVGKGLATAQAPIALHAAVAIVEAPGLLGFTVTA